jgi:hypothetical protein
MKFEELDLPSLQTPTLHTCLNKQRYIVESAKCAKKPLSQFYQRSKPGFRVPVTLATQEVV